MRLYEFEAKQLLRQAQIETPLPIQVAPLDELEFHEPCVLKAQVLFGNRWGKGLIQPCLNKSAFVQAVTNLRSSLKDQNAESNTLILVEPLLPTGSEMYLAIRYDTQSRLPVINFDPKGGTGIEERAQSLQTFPLTDLTATPIPHLHADIHSDWLRVLVETFFSNDMTLLEINPLILHLGRPLALDAKIELEDTAIFRHSEWEAYPARTLFVREPSPNELQAKAVNAMDHRGVAGASYFDLEGTIGILASGGGASQLAMDALLSSGLAPANYTEYSGNPTREKVKALSQIVLSKPNLEGLWVVGGHANFTDIYETLMGVTDALEEASLPTGFPVVVRRGGPRTREAFGEMKQRCQNVGLRIELFDSEFPLTDTVPVLVGLVEDYRKGNN